MMKLFATGPTAFESVTATVCVNDRVVRWLGQTVAGLTDTDPVLVVPTGVVLAGGTWVGQRQSATTDLSREDVMRCAYHQRALVRCLLQEDTLLAVLLAQVVPRD